MTRSRWLFGSAVFLGAFLLFLVEPMAARQLLPVLGGSAAVWITCLVFFQTALLLGYLYAHQGSRKTIRVAHIGLLIGAAVEAAWWSYLHVGIDNASDHPVWSVFKQLSAWIGVPFIVLAATSPLLQLWWSRVESGEIPWRFYALSNLASLLALALYPSVGEPYLTLHAQRVLWFWLFVLFALLSVPLTLKVRTRHPAPLHTDSAKTTVDESALPKSPLPHKLLWFLPPMGAAMQLSAGTSYLPANVAAIPLLWILPLSVYLITIIIAFQFRRRVPPLLLGRFLIIIL